MTRVTPGLILLIMAAIFVSVYLMIVPVPSQLFDDTTKEIAATGNSVGTVIEPQNACVYTSWQGRLPPFITLEDNQATRKRYDTLRLITTTDPLPFSNVVLRSSFKAGSTFMGALVRSLYEGNETRQGWLNETRKLFPHHKVQPWVAAAFLRDPIDRFASIYGQMLQFSNRKYHWYGEGDADWLDIPEGPDRVKTFVASVKRRFYNEHILPQLWFLSEDQDRAPNLTFVGRLERLSDDWTAITANPGNFHIPSDVARDGQIFIDSKTSSRQTTDRSTQNLNMHRNENAKISVHRALYEEPDANATLLDVCNIYRADFSCFSTWLQAPAVCTEAWRKEES
jgi:hypothetical protein